MNIIYDDNGEGWEEGAPYEFSHDGETWCLGALGKVFTGSDRCSYRTKQGAYWKYIRICQSPLIAGKKHRKPVELDPGSLCKWRDGGRLHLGWYSGVDGDGLRQAIDHRDTIHNLDAPDVREIVRLVEAEEI